MLYRGKSITFETVYIPEGGDVDLVVLKILQVQALHVKRGEGVVVLSTGKQEHENEPRDF